MAENSGSSGLLGVIIGAVLVLGVGAFLFYGNVMPTTQPSKASIDINVKPAAPSSPAPVTPKQ